MEVANFIRETSLLRKARSREEHLYKGVPEMLLEEKDGTGVMHLRALSILELK